MALKGGHPAVCWPSHCGGRYPDDQRRGRGGCSVHSDGIYFFFAGAGWQRCGQWIRGCEWGGRCGKHPGGGKVLQPAQLLRSDLECWPFLQKLNPGRTTRRLPYLALCRREERTLTTFLDSLARWEICPSAKTSSEPCRSAERVAQEGDELALSHNTA